MEVDKSKGKPKQAGGGRWWRVWAGLSRGRGKTRQGCGSGLVSWAGDLHSELLSKVGDASRTENVRTGWEKKGAHERRGRTNIY